LDAVDWQSFPTNQLLRLSFSEDESIVSLRLFEAEASDSMLLVSGLLSLRLVEHMLL